MPPGAKKRKALKKKQHQKQQESNGTSTNTKGSNCDNLHEKENGSQDGRGSDDNNSSTPDSSQGNGQFGTKVPSSLVSDTVKEMSDAIAFERGTDDKKLIVEKLPISSENSTQAAKNIACQDATAKEIAPVVDSVSKAVVPEKSEHPETSTHSDFVNKKSDDEKKEYPSTGLEKDNGNVVTLPGSAPRTSQKVESVRESEAPVSSEEKRLLLPGPPAVRTSWLSCCGLFDAVTGSDR